MLDGLERAYRFAEGNAFFGVVDRASQSLLQARSAFSRKNQQDPVSHPRPDCRNVAGQPFGGGIAEIDRTDLAGYVAPSQSLHLHTPLFCYSLDPLPHTLISPSLH